MRLPPVSVCAGACGGFPGSATKPPKRGRAQRKLGGRPWLGPAGLNERMQLGEWYKLSDG